MLRFLNEKQIDIISKEKFQRFFFLQNFSRLQNRNLITKKKKKMKIHFHDDELNVLKCYRKCPILRRS